MNTREREGILVGVGAGLTLIVLLVLQSFVGSGTLATTTVTSTTTATVSTIPAAYEQVASDYANHLLLLDARNASALLSGYESNATVEWTGDTGGLAGNYIGTGNGSGEFGGVLDYFLTDMVNLTVSNENQTIATFQGGHWVINSTFDWVAYNSDDGNISGIVAAQDSYAHVGNTWVIARETWNWLSLDCQFPACRSP